MIKPPYGRKQNIEYIFNYLDNIKEPLIFEVGMTRNLHPWAWMHDGYFTLIMNWYLEENNKGKIISVDIDLNALKNCKLLLEEYSASQKRSELICCDIFKYDYDNKQNIDILYLDAWDYTIHVPEYGLYLDDEININSEKNHLNAFLYMEKYLNKDSLIIIDDVLNTNTYEGKGKQLIPYMLNNGYSIIPQSLIKDEDIKERDIYQLILSRK